VSRLDSRSDRPRGVLVRRPKTTIYTVLLGIAVGALAIGCLLLAIEIMQYGSLFPGERAAWNIPSGFGR
jgi:hypothetical protein